MKFNWRVSVSCLCVCVLAALLIATGCSTNSYAEKREQSIATDEAVANANSFEWQRGQSSITRGHSPASESDWPVEFGGAEGADQYHSKRSNLPSKMSGRSTDQQDSPSARLRAAMPAGSLPGLDEEVWVIVKHEPEENTGSVKNYNDEVPGSGAMMCRYSDEMSQSAPPMPLPLKHTEVSANISAYIASVEVTQQFHNPFSSKIEALYVFPLPDNAAISGFIMTIGERKIRGILRDREQAEQIYHAAKSQGYTASLLTQERPNVFTQAVANIEPGREVDVNITYFHTLAYHDGWYEYVFPMVVGPRFNPPCERDGIGAVTSAPRDRSGQPTDVHYLAPNERSGHDIGVTVSIDASVPIEDIKCTSHDIDISNRGSSHAQIRLASHDTIPNKDFVLRYRVAGDTVQTGFLSTVTPQGGFFTLMLYPPHTNTHLRRAPLELVFVIDCSGSMKGEPLRLAKQAVLRALDRLEPGDSFQVIRFASEASHFGREPVEANWRNIESAERYVENLEAGGGTMMIEGIRAALDFPHDRKRLRYVVFLTDGFIGNESEVLGAVDDHLGDAHIFSFGIGSSPNRALMERMAKFGRGAVAYIGLRDISEDVMDAFLDRIAQPALTNISIDWGNLAVHDVVPAKLPALFVGRPIIVTGRFNPQQSGSSANIVIKGTAAGERVEARVNTPFYDAAENRALAAVWARSMMADIMDRATIRPSDTLNSRLRGLALDYGLMSPFTAFVAVDSSQRTTGGYGTTVPVGVPVPEGVRYDTTVANSPSGGG